MIRTYKVEKSIYYSKDNKLYNLMLYTETEHGYGCGKVFEGTRDECILEKRRILGKYSKNKELSKCYRYKN